MSSIVLNDNISKDNLFIKSASKNKLRNSKNKYISNYNSNFKRNSNIKSKNNSKNGNKANIFTNTLNDEITCLKINLNNIKSSNDNNNKEYNKFSKNGYRRNYIILEKFNKIPNNTPLNSKSNSKNLENSNKITSDISINNKQLLKTNEFKLKNIISNNNNNNNIKSNISKLNLKQDNNKKYSNLNKIKSKKLKINYNVVKKNNINVKPFNCNLSKYNCNFKKINNIKKQLNNDNNNNKDISYYNKSFNNYLNKTVSSIISNYMHIRHLFFTQNKIININIVNKYNTISYLNKQDKKIVFSNINKNISNLSINNKKTINSKLVVSNKNNKNYKIKLSEDYVYNKLLGKGEYSIVELFKLKLYKINNKNKNNNLTFNSKFNIIYKQDELNYIVVKKYNKDRLNKVLNNYIKNEIDILSNIKNESIIKLLKYEETKTNVSLINKIYYNLKHILIFEYFYSETLFSFIINKHYLTNDHKQSIIYSIAKAIRYLHSNNISHRDIKAENILLNTNSFNIKIIDFGYAIKFKQNNELCSDYCGTYSYMAPEILNREIYDPFKADIWSFGILIYFILCNKLPFINITDIKNKKICVNNIYNLNISDCVVNNLSIYEIDLIKSILQINSSNRPSIDKVLNHTYFININLANI